METGTREGWNLQDTTDPPGFPLDGFAALPLAQFLVDLLDHAFTRPRLHLLPQAPQRDAHDIAMMESGTQRLGGAQIQPDIVQQVDVFRPHPWRMRTQVHEYRRPIRTDHFQRERISPLGAPLPSP